MKTDDLIAFLAQDAGPAQGPAAEQVGGRLAIGMVTAFLMVLYLGLNPSLRAFAATSPFTVKMVWLFVLLVFSAILVYRLIHPGRRMGGAPWGIGFALLAMAGLGLIQLLQAPPEQRTALWMGATWRVCAINIAFIALPMLAALLWTLRDMAPTQRTLAGAMSGVLAGALAAMLYSLHCPENSFAFYALWYSGGMGLSALVGAALSAWFLRW